MRFRLCTVEFEDGELRAEGCGGVRFSTVGPHASALVDVIAEHDSLRRRSVSERAAVQDLLKILLARRRAALFALVWALLVLSVDVAAVVVPFTGIDLNWNSVVLDLHLSVQALVHVILVVLVDLVQQVLVFDAQKLVLEQGHVRLLVLDFLERLLRFLVITDELVVLALLFFLLVIYLEKLDFSLELLIEALDLALGAAAFLVIVGSSQANEPVAGNLLAWRRLEVLLHL